MILVAFSNINDSVIPFVSLLEYLLLQAMSAWSGTDSGKVYLPVWDLIPINFIVAIWITNTNLF